MSEEKYLLEKYKTRSQWGQCQVLEDRSDGTGARCRNYTRLTKTLLLKTRSGQVNINYWVLARVCEEHQ